MAKIKGWQGNVFRLKPLGLRLFKLQRVRKAGKYIVRLYKNEGGDWKLLNSWHANSQARRHVIEQDIKKSISTACFKGGKR